MSPHPAKHSAQEEKLMKQLISELGPKTPLAKLTLANWKAQKSSPGRVKATPRRPPGTTEIELDQLEDSPYQLRHEMDSDQLAELTRSIEENGLLNPILVRRAGDKYQVVSGHRRLAAYRRLQFAAQSEKDRQKYRAIPARELASVSDEQMLLIGLTENLLRADISPLDAALGLTALRKLKPALNTAKKLSETTGLQLNKVVRLLRLAEAPEVVQQGVQEGLMVPVPAEKNGRPDESAGESRRTLDLLAALEFARLHNALAKKEVGSKDGASPADERTREAIAHALKENWGFREVQHFVDKVISGGSAPGVKQRSGRPAAAFTRTQNKLVFYLGRLQALSAVQRQALRRALDDLLRRLGLKAVPLAEKAKNQR
jgi:ParB/RepB/Spo0J family partition protein